MNKAIGIALIFSAGAAVGSAVTWYEVKAKYEKIAQDEIDSVKELYANKANKTEETISVAEFYPQNSNLLRQAAELAKEKPDISEYAALLHENGYTSKSEEEMKDDMNDRPYVISPDEFGEMDDYAKVSLNYFIDGYLTDDNYELMDDIEENVGFESLNHFGEYEDDSVFVRNDKLKCDYEILLDQRNFMDVVKSLPHHVRV